MDISTLPSAKVSGRQVRNSSVDGEVVGVDRLTDWPGRLVGRIPAFVLAAISAGKEAQPRATVGFLHILTPSPSKETWFGTGGLP